MKEIKQNPRADAKLKRLPEDRQREIIERIKAPGETYKKVRAWLREDGIVTSDAALSYFWDWWHLQEQFRSDEATTEGLLEQLKAEIPLLSEEQLDDLGQRTFSLLAIRRQDLSGFVKMRSARTNAVLEREKLRLKETAEKRMQESLVLEKARFQRETCGLFLKWSEDERARAIAGGAASNSEKIERLGELMFGEDWK